METAHWIKHPESMGSEAVAKLPALIESQPWCPTWRLLYLMALANVHSTKLPDELKKTAVWIPNRMKMFSLVNNGEYDWIELMKQLEQKTAEQENAGDPFTLVDKYLSQMHVSTEEGTATYDLTSLAGTGPADDRDDALPLSDSEQAALDEQDALINSFLEAEETGTLFVPQVPETEAQAEQEEDVSKIHEKAFLTESLAKIYIRQHKYDQALNILRQLNGKYAGPGTYFADQIRFIELIQKYQKKNI